MSKSILLVAAALAVAPLAFAHQPAGTPKDYCEPYPDWFEHDYGALSVGQFSFVYYDGNLADCNGDGVPYDADGHFEYATGGAFFPVDSFGSGGGSVGCYGLDGHHPAFGQFTVNDLALGAGTGFIVGADTYDGTGLNPACGDGFVDALSHCVGSCSVTFPPGLDGSYYVFIDGTQGHAYLN